MADIDKIRVFGVIYDLLGGGGQPDAVVNITRNGNTFTATRADGTTFTFTQKDDDTKYGLSISGHTVSLVEGGQADSVTVPDNDSMPHHNLNSSTLDTTAGNFTFSGSGQPWGGTDWVGFQIGDNVDKFQVTRSNGNLLFRYNDSGGTDSANWSPWIMIPTFADVGNRTYYCTCTTAAGTAAKVVTVQNDANFVLKTGTVIGVYFSYSNTASNVTLNVNGTGAHPIWNDGGEYTGTEPSITGKARSIRYYMYSSDGYWMAFRHPSGTAGQAQVLTGYTFSNDGSDGLTGTMPDRGAATYELSPGGSYTILYGYHNGFGTIRAKLNSDTYTPAAIDGTYGNSVVVDMGAYNLNRYINAINLLQSGLQLATYTGQKFSRFWMFAGTSHPSKSITITTRGIRYRIQVFASIRCATNSILLTLRLTSSNPSVTSTLTQTSSNITRTFDTSFEQGANITNTLTLTETSGTTGSGAAYNRAAFIVLYATPLYASDINTIDPTSGEIMFSE